MFDARKQPGEKPSGLVQLDNDDQGALSFGGGFGVADRKRKRQGRFQRCEEHKPATPRRTPIASENLHHTQRITHHAACRESSIIPARHTPDNGGQTAVTPRSGTISEGKSSNVGLATFLRRM